MLLKHRIQDVERHEAFDQDAQEASYLAEYSRESVYPRLCGAFGARLGMVTKLTRELLDELVKVTRRKEALEWAAENVLDNGEGEDYEMLYAVADVAEEALKNGMTDDELRERLRVGIEDGKFIEIKPEAPEARDLTFKCKNGGDIW